MTYFIVAIKALLILVALPIILFLYIDKAKASQRGRLSAWSYGNIPFWFMMVAVVCGIALEIYSYQIKQPKSDEQDPLTFLNMRAYEQDLQNYPQRTSIANWKSGSEQLLRKFEHAQYVWQSGDYKEACKSLMELESGKDDFGNLLHVPSVVVNNNLGCAFFKLQRNRGFKAFIYLNAALSISKPTHPQKDIVEENIRKLDLMVNLLD